MIAEVPNVPAPPVPTTHPRGLYTLFFTEMWERFSYYGMRALLILFMAASVEKGGLGFSEQIAGAIYGLYVGGGYLAALPGGWGADRVLGAQRAGVIGGGLIVGRQFFPGLAPHPAAYLWFVSCVAG